jgi:hypothetical protein
MRLNRVAKAQEFVRKFPLKGFLFQAPQALYTVTKELTGTGYGLVLGSIEGFKSDVVWAVLRGNPLEKTRINGPPPSDLLGKAYRYLLQAPFQYFRGADLSYDDHWLLSAADAVATRIIQEATPVADLDERWAVAKDSPLIDFEPWHPASLELFAELGLDWRAPQAPPISGMDDNASYFDVLGEVLAGYPVMIEEARADFPATTAATALQLIINENGLDVLNYLAGGDAGVVPVFEPEELTFARLFEAGIFPPADTPGDLLGVFLERALELARALGLDLPGPRELRTVATEFGWPSQPG